MWYNERVILFESSNLHVGPKGSCAKSENKETTPTVKNQHENTVLYVEIASAGREPINVMNKATGRIHGEYSTLQKE